MYHVLNEHMIKIKCKLIDVFAYLLNLHISISYTRCPQKSNRSIFL